MARSHGRVYSAIWNDKDFLALGPGPQRMYMFLLSQPNLNHAGLLPLTMTRWAGRCAGTDAGHVRRDLEALAVARFVVLDAGAEEVLVRTLVRNDGVYKQPLIMKRLVEDAQEITSPKLRAALLAELARIPLDELSDEPAGRDRSAPSVRQVAVDAIQAIRKAYGDPPADPSGRVTDTLREGLAEPPARTRARPPSPFPSPIPKNLAPACGERETKSRPPDEIWDAVMAACGVDTTAITKSARGAYNRAVADLRAVGATPFEIRRRAKLFAQKWPAASLTPTALARRWSELGRASPLGNNQPPPVAEVFADLAAKTADDWHDPDSAVLAETGAGLLKAVPP